MLSRRRMLALLTAGPAVGPLAAAPQATFSSAVNVVSVLVTVRDQNGGLLNDLEQDDFIVEEDRQPQTITYFSRQYDLPLTLGLLVDTSQSQFSVLREELAASSTFFEQMLREGVDQAFLKRFDERDFLLQNVTMSRAPLQAALQLMEARVRANPSVQGTLLYDSIADSADGIMKRFQGRKALVLLTDGDDVGSKHSLDTAIESCQRADTAVYSIGIGTSLAKGSGALETLSRRTGGRYFEVSRKLRVEAIYQTIEEELRNQYNIGYAPPPSAAGKSNRNGFHAIRITVKRRGAVVTARDGYYSAK